MSHDPEPVPEWSSMSPPRVYDACAMDDPPPITFATYARTIETAQSDNARIEYLTARVLYLHGEVVALRARIDVLERDGNGERG